MVNLRAEITDVGMRINDQFFYERLTNSLPSYLDLFIALYEDSTYDVDLCDKFAKYEMWHKLAALAVGKANTTTDYLLALFGQQAS